MESTTTNRMVHASKIREKIRKETEDKHKIPLSQEISLIIEASRKMYEESEIELLMTQNIIHIWSKEAKNFAENHGFKIVLKNYEGLDYDKWGVYLTLLPEEE